MVLGRDLRQPAHLVRLHGHSTPAALAFAAGSLAACGGSGTPSECRAQVSEPIYGGTIDAGARDLAAAAGGAIVEVETSGGALLCTGTLLSPGRVLTAAHCKLGEQMLVRVPLEGWQARSQRLVVHPQLDAMLVEFDGTGHGSSRLPLSTTVVTGGWIGKPVHMAGFGRTETGDRGELRFVEESVVNVQPNEIWVDGKGVSGACDGDSGGPLLWLDDAGSPSVIGVLSEGSSGCLGLDVYTPTSALTQWLSKRANEETCGAPP